MRSGPWCISGGHHCTEKTDAASRGTDSLIYLLFFSFLMLAFNHKSKAETDADS